MRKPRPRAEAAREPVTGIVSFHPQRGAIITLAPVPRGTWKYRGGKDSDWREVARVDVLVHSGQPEPVAGQWLPAGFLWGDTSVQVSGMGLFHQVYGPLERRCADCGTRFVWPAAVQKHLYEVERAHVDTVAKRCRACATVRRTLEKARTAYAAAIAATKHGTTAQSQLALARATLAVLDAGGRANLDRAIAAARAARRSGSGPAADVLEAKLVARRSP